MSITLVAPILVSSAMVMSPVGPPSGGEDLRSINETAELTSMAVTEERINVVEERISATAVRKYHGKLGHS